MNVVCKTVLLSHSAQSEVESESHTININAIRYCIKIMDQAFYYARWKYE